MQLVDFSLGGLRVFAEAECVLGPGLNWFVGANGAGKTSVLEAIGLLAMGRSFRCASLDPVLRSGAERWWVRGRVRSAHPEHERILAVGRTGRDGLERRFGHGQEARATDLAAALPVLVFDPSGSELVLGGSERRRRLLDWGVFHVEQGPAELWSRYQRALRQRNVALRSGDREAAAAWEGPLAEAGSVIAGLRAVFLEQWLAEFRGVSSTLMPELDDLGLTLSQGWGRDHESLGAALEAGRNRDLGLGYTYAGPHRADVVLRSRGAELRDQVSRGQARSLALGLVLSLASCFQARRDEAPLLLLDDVCAELDHAHLDALLDRLDCGGMQALMSSVETPRGRPSGRDRVFHVEQGRITPLLYSRA